ncbi:hypothetical protein QF026_008543 [Streptomyces aurantiacus]|uniref:hypothetical protein n=1 Tax=Streptomyces aurantiacus TaxID=47760 RepID=UPI00278EF3B4|nr:hypothetical protein [Streptomyces aurantiacus]MDQ0780077.1 hypothetical protein [Streptomyces aurantiacus]
MTLVHGPINGAAGRRRQQPALHLARLTQDDSWSPGPPSGFARRMVLATHQVLITLLQAPLAASPRVSAAAARSRSTTTPAAAAEPAVSANRQQAAPARGARRGR